MSIFHSYSIGDKTYQVMQEDLVQHANMIFNKMSDPAADLGNHP